MTPKEAKEFIAKARERGEASARAWHAGSKIRPSGKSEDMATVMKIKLKQGVRS